MRFDRSLFVVGAYSIGSWRGNNNQPPDLLGPVNIPFRSLFYDVIVSSDFSASAMAALGRSETVCKLEFAVQMTCEKCVNAVKQSLTDIQGVHGVTVNLELETVLVETTLSAQDIQTMLESSGRKAVLQGMGTNESRNLGAAVAMLSGEALIQGVVRFLQASEDNCIIDGTLDGLSPGLHGVHIHEFGDLSEGCASCGEHYNPDGSSHGAPGDIDHHVGDLGNIFANDEGQATFRMENERVKVWNIIGRSLVVDEKEDDLGQGNHPLSKITGNSGRRLACGIIARSAGLFENAKKICACDGVTIWEERECPIAGPERKRNKEPSANL